MLQFCVFSRLFKFKFKFLSLSMINKRVFHLDNPITHQYIKHPLTTLTQFNRNPRPWHMPLFVAFAISFPVMIGAYLSDLRMGLLASLGAMVILNLPYTGSLLSRMTTVLACSLKSPSHRVTRVAPCANHPDTPQPSLEN